MKQKLLTGFLKGCRIPRFIEKDEKATQEMMLNQTFECAVETECNKTAGQTIQPGVTGTCNYFMRCGFDVKNMYDYQSKIST